MTDNRNVALIVEDEFLIAEGFRSQLDLMGIEVCGVVSTADEAVDLAMEHNPGFVPGSREPETIERIAQDHPFATLFKPISAIQLKRTVERATC